MSTIIGSKASFGIEFDIYDKDPKLGHLRIWIQDTYIGDSNVPSYYYYICSIFSYIKDKESRLTLADSMEMDPAMFYEHVRNEKKKLTNDDVDVHILGIGDAFDDFFIVTYIRGEEIVFVWKLFDQDSERYPHYPSDLQIGIVRLAEFYTVAQEYSNRFCEGNGPD